ncbi:MAG: DUF2256 domain-containing protein [Myxococcota bacterium]
MRNQHGKNQHGKNLSRAPLPEKDCQHCQRPMRWRKSWARTWEFVQYCSERCQREAARVRRQGLRTSLSAIEGSS